MIWLYAVGLYAVVALFLGAILTIAVIDIRKDHQKALPVELEKGNLAVRLRMRNYARMEHQPAVLRAEHTWGWVWVYVPRRRRSARTGDHHEQIGWAATRRSARKQLAEAQREWSTDMRRRRNEAGGVAGAILGVIAITIALAWVLQEFEVMDADEFFQSIAAWLSRAFDWLFG